MLKPLQTFLAATDGGQRLAPPARVAWARDVAAAVCGHYLSLAATTLDTVRKNEEALRRLRKAEAAEKPSQLNDSHKICVQLCLDVAAFGEQVGAMGVEVATLDAFAELQQTVRPDEALLAATLG